MKIAITADDTCDLPKEYLEKYNITLTYIPNILGDEECRGNVTSDKIYEYVEKTGALPRTAALNSMDYKELFEDALKDNDVVIHFSLSSGISSTCANAQKAAEEFENVHVVDTKSLSSGSGLLVLLAAEMAKNGEPVIEILNVIKHYIDKIQASFIISKLDYLKKGGRCSSVAAFGANLLGLKILIELKEGKMVATKKYMGKIDSTLSKYLKDMIKEYPPEMKRVFVTSSSKMPGVRENLVKQVKALGFEEVIVSDAGATISSHCGPGTIGVLYIKK